ncbi:ABC transporter ATP-binding protein [Roseovarius indicus]|uniref:ABC transporter ATP-binding protein n=1 Tax=Roseovarius indicus TaxID=540747 RepID=UPI0032EBA1B3
MTATTGNVLSVDSLNVDYALPRRSLFTAPGHFRAVRNATFSIKSGASLALVGESGSGKSSLAKAVMGLEPASSGTVTLFDQDVASLSPEAFRKLRQRFQMIFQDPYGSLDPLHSIERIIVEPLLGVDRKTARDRAAKVLSDVGLSADDLKKYPHQFSGGQRQRIAIARSLVTRPELIVADEPVSALDVSVQAQVLNLMQDLRAEYGMAYLFISHDLAVVEYLCEDIVVLFRGTIVESGKTRDVMRNPMHPYTQELVAAMPRIGRRKRGVGAEPTAPVDRGPKDVSESGGCPYKARCPLAAPVCDGTPKLRPIEGGRHVACHFA